jgi:hypothetical protein
VKLGDGFDNFVKEEKQQRPRAVLNPLIRVMTT